MSATAADFYFNNRLEAVLYGEGKVASLGRELERRGARRALIVTGKTLGRSRLLEQVKQACGNALAGAFTGTAQHVPSKTVLALADEARRLEADALVSFGGGSPNDCAKAAIMNVIKSGGREIILIAIPTTLSAGEFTPAGGITDEATMIKGGVADARLMARAVILDPVMTTETPAWLWASTAMRSLDHAVESSYSSRHQPFTDTLAARAIAMLDEHLMPSLKGGGDELEHRLQCQLAAWFSIFGMNNTRAGISHALGHQIGPRWNVPHGVTSCITLPHVMRFMAGVAPERFAPIAQGLGLRFDASNPKMAAQECADRVARFIGKFEVPNRLRDVGVAREEIGSIAETVLEEVKRSNTVGREVTTANLLEILEAAY
ncbi:MAG TPA: iron-containing alcohol dehydrogenase [Candidatus Binataceae bacterium]|nr:iron-containing alcohol dehydrogenase [Candidatus Binataceae bacterium]